MSKKNRGKKVVSANLSKARYVKVKESMDAHYVRYGPDGFQRQLNKIAARMSKEGTS